jgi:hypothetical protein
MVYLTTPYHFDSTSSDTGPDGLYQSVIGPRQNSEVSYDVRQTKAIEDWQAGERAAFEQKRSVIIGNLKVIWLNEAGEPSTIETGWLSQAYE